MASSSTDSYPRYGSKITDTDFNNLVQTTMRYKVRSDVTHKDTHIPELSSSTDDIDVVYLGDSMLERLKGAGRETKLNALKNSFNAGVGGDKVQNVLYRIDLGLLKELGKRKVKLFVVHVGTNNLQKKRPMASRDIEAFHILLEAIHRNCPTAKILVTELFRRQDVELVAIQQSNEQIKALVDTLHARPDWNISHLPATIAILAPTILDIGMHMADHVHLNKAGYEIWDDELYPVIETLLYRSEIQNT